MGMYVTVPVNRLAYKFGDQSDRWWGPAQASISTELEVRWADPFPSGFPHKSEVTANFFRRNAQPIEKATYSISAGNYYNIARKLNFIKETDEYTCILYNGNENGYLSISAFLSDSKFSEFSDIARSYVGTEFRINFSCGFNGFRNDLYTNETVPSADEFLREEGAYVAASRLDIAILPPRR